MVPKVFWSGTTLDACQRFVEINRSRQTYSPVWSDTYHAFPTAACLSGKLVLAYAPAWTKLSLLLRGPDLLGHLPSRCLAFCVLIKLNE